MASLTPDKAIKLVNAIADFFGTGKPGIGHNKSPEVTPLERWQSIDRDNFLKAIQPEVQPSYQQGLGFPTKNPTSVERAGFPVRKGESGPGPEIPQEELDDTLIQELLDENPELIQTLDKIIEENPLVANMDTASKVQMAREHLEMDAMKRLGTLQDIPPREARQLKQHSDVSSKVKKEIDRITQEDASRLPESMGGRTASREVTGNIDDDVGMQATSYSAGIADPKDLQKQVKGEVGQDYLRQVEADFEGKVPSPGKSVAERNPQNRPVRVVIAGGRNFRNTNAIKEEFDKLLKTHSPSDVTVISGTAGGVDQFGERLAKAYGIPVIRMPANWKKYGDSAGPKRNMLMASKGTHLLAGWDGQSAGTRNMIQEARERGIPINVVGYNAKKHDPNFFDREVGQGKPRLLESWEKRENIETLKAKPGVTEKEISEAEMGTWGPKGSPKVRTEKADKAYQDLEQRLLIHENNLDNIETNLTNPQALRILAADAGQRQIIDRALKDSFDEIADIQSLLKTFESRVTKGKTSLGKTGTASFFRELESTKARVKALRRELQQAGKLSGRQTALGQTPETKDILEGSKGGARLVPEADRDALRSIKSFSQGGYPSEHLWKQLTKDKEPPFPTGRVRAKSAEESGMTRQLGGEVLDAPRAPTAKEMAETTKEMETSQKLQSMLEGLDYSKITKGDQDQITLIRILKELLEGGEPSGLSNEQSALLLRAIQGKTEGKSIPLSNFQEMLQDRGGRAFDPLNLEEPSLWKELIE